MRLTSKSAGFEESTVPSLMCVARAHSTDWPLQSDEGLEKTDLPKQEGTLQLMAFRLELWHGPFSVSPACQCALQILNFIFHNQASQFLNINLFVFVSCCFRYSREC